MRRPHPRSGATSLMTYLAALSGVVLGAGYLAYKTGFDVKIFRALSSAMSAIFMEIVIVMMRGGTSLLSLLPDFPVSLNNHSSITSVIEIGATMNQFLPLVEMLVAFAAFVTFLLIFIAVKLVLKLIPMIG